MKFIDSLFPKYTTPVFTAAFFLTVCTVVIGAIFPVEFQAITSELRAFITHSFGWYYLLITMGMVALCFFFILTPAGSIRLGDPGSKPEYSTLSWLSMLFSAGMGIGLVFFGTAEPLSHFAVAPPMAEAGSQAALEESLRYTFFHWGIHAWSIYAIVALALAYFKFRKKERSLLSMTLKPLFGNRVERLGGRIIDCVSLIATAIGVATSLGFGAAQISSGLSYLLGTPDTFLTQLGIIVSVTVLFLMSAFSGLDKGVRLLSNTNVVLAIVMLLIVLAVGPTVFIMNAFVDTIGSYLQNFIRMSFRTAAFDASHHGWIEGWTIVYWAWWLSWSPFVGVFIARISRGRTIREFLTCVILIPTLFSFLWFSVFGILAADAYRLMPSLAQLPAEQVLFGVFNLYPFGSILSGLAVFLLIVFFITSADSATYVLAMLSEDGSLLPHNNVKSIWGILISSIAALLLAVGGLNGLQNLLMITAFPFSFVIILMMVALYVELRHERQEMGLYLKPETYPSKDNPFRSYEN